jgi:hypothetical protein
MRDFEDSSLWRVSAFERVRRETGSSGYVRLDGPTILPSTMLADLQRLHENRLDGDTLEIVAMCMRHREPALLCLQYEDVVWPITIFPNEGLYHSPHDMALASTSGLANLKLLTCEPPGVRPPGHGMHERIARRDQYRPLAPFLWQLALKGPRSTVLGEIGGTAAYRASLTQEGQSLSAPGALGSAIERMRRESVSLREISSWPGLSAERAGRLVNALYLTSGLIVTRAHPAARSQPSGSSWFGLRRKR